MKLYCILRRIESDLMVESKLPPTAELKDGAYIGLLTNLQQVSNNSGPKWRLQIVIKDRQKTSSIYIPLESFLTDNEYKNSLNEPLCFADIQSTKQRSDNPIWLWIFQDSIYMTDRIPRESERETVRLLIKALHFNQSRKIERLRELVANHEAIEQTQKSGVKRRTIPDDTKLFVWTRDCGACVKCGSTTEIHFDHIIPLSRGGTNDAINLQILCRKCNLAKGNRII